MQPRCGADSMFRFRDYTTYLAEFENEIWVRCPRCDRPVRSRRLDDRLTWRIACPHCSYTHTASRLAQHQKPMPWWTGNWWTEYRNHRGAVDPLFGLPLWLQVPCCGEVLWAYNEAHLEFLETYVRATIRERQGGKGNHHGMATRLPRWMKLAKHRAPILKQIQHLRDRLQTGP
jgi:DNA-directed RNA polymerase subunit RPC12/RpoP